MEYQIDNRASPINFQSSDQVMRTLQNAKNLLMTRMGEVPYDRMRGLNPAIYDLPLTALQWQLVPELDRVMRWEPDVEVVSGEATMDEEGFLYIKVILDVNTQ